MNIFTSMAIQLFIVGLVVLAVMIWVYSDDIKHYLKRSKNGET